jgi:hypothetical protein
MNMTLMKYKAIPFAVALMLFSVNTYAVDDQCPPDTTCVEVPEPTSVAIFAIGIMGLIVSRIKKK